MDQISGYLGRYATEEVKEMAYNQNNRQSEYRSNQGNQRGRQQGQQSDKIAEILKKIRAVKNLGEISIEEIAKENGIAETLAKEMRNNELKPTQLRKVFDSVRTIQDRLSEYGWDARAQTDFYMIRPYLAYANGRGNIPNEFFEIISACLERVESSDERQRRDNFDRLVQFLESLVAYQKYHNKKRSW
jgi:CRISPR-associated protein Csm2